MSFPAEVRAEMGRQGMRPVELAKKLGVAESTVSRKIQTETTPISLEDSVAIARALGVPVWELMRRAETSERVAS